MGEEKLVALLQESLAVATRTEAMRPTSAFRHATGCKLSRVDVALISCNIVAMCL